MKATIHTELRCGSCGQMMQYHQDVKVRCVQLKCEERNKEYNAPMISLQPVNEKEKPQRGRPKTVKD